MELLDLTHNPWLVLASFAVALMAGFTGLSLTQGASRRPVAQRKLLVALAAVALGGGIWSMHFVAMLGMQLPILFYYDPLITLISALAAILVVGLALLVLHFRPRGLREIVIAGALVGTGIVLMHFIGMAGMRLCRPVNGAFDYVLALMAAIVLSIAAIWVAYDTRSKRSILIGTIGFAAAVVSVHFVAIALTGFTIGNDTGGAGPAMSKEILAMGVTVAAFVICGAFLLSGVSFIEPEAEETAADLALATPAPDPDGAAGIPYEKDGHTHFAARSQVAAIRAEGHYTVLYLGDEKLFCPWSISEAEKRLASAGMLRCHRSYLIAPAHVTRFERHKDTGTCYFEETGALTKVPVSRSRMAEVREALGL